MTIELRPGTLRDVTYIAANMRAEDWREVYSSCPTEDRAEAGMLCWAMSQGWSWTVWLQHTTGCKCAGCVENSRGNSTNRLTEPVCAFGFAPTGLPWVWTAWAFGTERMKRAVPAVTRFGRDDASRMLIGAGVRRVEIRSIADHDIAHRWLSGLGAKRECELRDYGRNGETYVLWSWTLTDWQRRDDAASLKTERTTDVLHADPQHPTAPVTGSGSDAAGP